MEDEKHSNIKASVCMKPEKARSSSPAGFAENMELTQEELAVHTCGRGGSCGDGLLRVMQFTALGKHAFLQLTRQPLF